MAEFESKISLRPDGNRTVPMLFKRLDTLSEAAAYDLKADGVLMSVFQSDKFYSLGAYPSLGPQLSDRKHDAEETVCLHTIKRGTPLLAEDARTDSTLKDTKYVRDGIIVGYLGIPIVSAQFGTIGSICSVTRHPRKWEKLEVNYLQQVANNAELLLLQEMGRLELEAFSDSISDLDRIVMTLSSNTTSPISIYEPGGSLVFANTSLLEAVPEKIVTDFWSTEGIQLLAQGGFSKYAGENLALGDRMVKIDDIPGEKRLLNVSCRASRSGLILCIWNDGLTLI